jgi:hypothetical protein
VNQPAWQPLQSAQWLPNEPLAPCYICGATGSVNTEYCPECLAPMELTRQATGRNQPPYMVGIVGASGVGKTVYLGLLMDMLSRQTEGMQFLARGAFSIDLQQTTLTALSRCRFPGKTCNEPDRWNWVYCQVQRGPRSPAVELIMPDMAGESLLEEIDHHNTYRVIKEFLRKSSAALLLIDAIRLRDGDRSQDYFAMKLLSYLSEVEPQGKHGWSERPIAVVFTKVDQAEECRDDPAGFARAHAAGLWQHCRQRFSNHRFFAASVVGAYAWHETATEGRHRVPLRIEPRGIIEPFEWLMEQAAGEKKKRPSLLSTLSTQAAALSFAGR